MSLQDRVEFQAFLSPVIVRNYNRKISFKVKNVTSRAGTKTSQKVTRRTRPSKLIEFCWGSSSQKCQLELIFELIEITIYQRTPHLISDAGLLSNFRILHVPPPLSPGLGYDALVMLVLHQRCAILEAAPTDSKDGPTDSRCASPKSCQYRLTSQSQNWN